MCNTWCLEFARLVLPYIGNQERVLEVGSRNVNGTTREVLSTRAREYIGIDIYEGPGVDKVLDVKELTSSFDLESFDVVTSTEMLEHCHDWQDALFRMIAVLRIGGILLITTRSPGFELHDYPGDYWRFSISDFENIFSPIGNILALQSDMTCGWACGIGIILRKTASLEGLNTWCDSVGKMTMYSMVEESRIIALMENTEAAGIIFDQYSRYGACSKIVERISQAGDILDVGSGPECLLGRFLPDRTITYADPLLANTDNNENRIAGNIFDKKLDSKKFDYVCSVDTLEHVPEDMRNDFIERISDLAARGIVLGFPCSDDTTAFQVDKTVDDAYRRAYGKGYSWLDEHFRYTLPKRKDVVSLLQGLGWTVSVVGHGHAPWLSLLLSDVICGWEIPDAHSNVLRISKRFNVELYPYDFNPPFYRWFVVAVKKSSSPISLKFGTPIDDSIGKRFREILADAHAGLFSSFQNVAIERDTAIAERNAEKVERNAMTAKWQATEVIVNTMRNSNSWRITHPLRLIARIFRHGQI